MTKFYLYGEHYEVLDQDTQVRVQPGELISSPAKAVLLQTPDRKHAHVVFLGTGGEAYGLPVMASRLDDQLAEHLQAHLLLVEAGKSGK